MSVPKYLQQRGKILDEIMRHHREQLPKVMRDVPADLVRAVAAVAPPTADFCVALKRQGVRLIAECKKASPSKGLLMNKYKPAELAQTYVQGGAAAISVLTDARHFQGSLDDLRQVKEAVKVPVLRKDFIFDPYQVYEARAAGADAILLIVSVLGDNDLKTLLNLAHELTMNVLVEVHTEQELQRALAVNPRIIGINNRNLQTFEVDFGNTARLREMIPDEIVVVAESGIKTAADVQQLGEIGVDAILVGETLVKSKNILKTVQELVAAGKPQR